MKTLQRLLIELIRKPLLWLWWGWRGWEVRQPLSDDIDKFIIAAAPHTTNWDYIHLLAGALYIHRRPNVTIKSELFFPPLGWILRALGGISIDRSGSYNVVDQLVAEIKAADRFMMVFTPEGTRSYNKAWKTGFYYTALKADVPIVCATIHYEEKWVEFGLILEPTGDIVADFEKIADYFDGHGRALYPEKRNPVTLSERHLRRLDEREHIVTDTPQASVANASTGDDTSATAQD